MSSAQQPYHLSHFHPLLLINFLPSPCFLPGTHQRPPGQTWHVSSLLEDNFSISCLASLLFPHPVTLQGRTASSISLSRTAPLNRSVQHSLKEDCSDCKLWIVIFLNIDFINLFLIRLWLHKSATCGESGKGLWLWGQKVPLKIKFFFFLLLAQKFP